MLGEPDGPRDLAIEQDERERRDVGEARPPALGGALREPHREEQPAEARHRRDRVGGGSEDEQGRVAEPESYYASPVAAGGKILLASKSGQLSVITANPEWELLSTHRIDEEIWSTPAIADGQVFIRSQTALYCFEGDPEE